PVRAEGLKNFQYEKYAPGYADLISGAAADGLYRIIARYAQNSIVLKSYILFADRVGNPGYNYKNPIKIKYGDKLKPDKSGFKLSVFGRD
ncbi:MAG TPA: hypothetical protein VI233_02315, partial [Puia sp.]